MRQLLAGSKGHQALDVRTSASKKIKSIFRKLHSDEDDAPPDSLVASVSTDQPNAQPDSLATSTPTPISPDGLCEECRNIDWDSALSFKGAPVRKVARCTLLSPLSCSLCAFLIESLGTYPERPSHDLLAVHIEPSLTPLLETVDAFVLGLVPEWDFPFRTFFSFRSNIIFEVNDTTAQTLRPITPTIDAARIKSWLDFCLDCHTIGCSTSGIVIPNLFVIECSTRKIVALPSGAAYLTLSYVWGTSHAVSQPTSVAPSKPRILPPGVPSTVEDAMTVTLSVGYEYLWVDKYCIFAEDAAFDAQLKQMHRIYQNSVLTIIAAAGTDSAYGLPGVSRLRAGSPQVQLSGRILASVPKSVDEDLASSKWYSRGWTYQEGLLSTRRVIFTERQLYFECQGYYCYEGLVSSPGTLLKIHRPDGQGYVKGLQNLTNDGSVARQKVLGQFPPERIGTQDWHIKLRIEECSYRSLTYENDKINAFLGLFELARDQFQVNHVWGVPFPLRDRCFSKRGSAITLRRASFVESLYWMLEEAGPRIEGFPSWSWTGWRGIVRWPYVVTYMNCNAGQYLDEWGPLAYEITDARFKISLEMKGGSLFDLVSCVTPENPGDGDGSLFHDYAATRFIHVACNLTHIVPPSEMSDFYYTLESSSTAPGPNLSKLNIEHEDGVTDTDDLFGMHMPWSRDERLIIIRQHGECWERVGNAVCYGIMNEAVLKTWQEIRLG